MRELSGDFTQPAREEPFLQCSSLKGNVTAHYANAPLLPSSSLTVADVRDGDLVDDARVEPVGGRREALHRRVQPLARREQRGVIAVRRDGLTG